MQTAAERKRALSNGDVVQSNNTGKHYVIHGVFKKADGTVAFYKAHHVSDPGYEYTFRPISIRPLTKREKDVLVKKMKAGNYEASMPVRVRTRRRPRISAA